MISFTATKDELLTTQEIAQRAMAIARRQGTKVPLMDFVMDVTAIHANGCPLDLEGLLLADNFNFTHDVFGIAHHIDRKTGKLRDCFLPRYATA